MWMITIHLLLLTNTVIHVSPEWVIRGNGDYHYYFSDEKNNQVTARSRCKGYGADLTSIVNSDEQSFIDKEVNRIEQTGYWIGLQTNNSCDSCANGENSPDCTSCRNKWYWLDGEPNSYQNWENDQPKKKDHQCSRWFGPNSQWRDGSCSGGNYKYICKTQNICKTYQGVCEHGTCSVVYTSERYNCTCQDGFEGRNCSKDINECISDPCLQGSNCTDGLNDYMCNCPTTWKGKNCQIDVDECAHKMCKNEATCSNFPGGFTCTCGSGFTGKTCAADIDECLLETSCSNDTKCRNTPGSFVCISKDDAEASSTLRAMFNVSLACCCLTGAVCALMLANDIRETRCAKSTNAHKQRNGPIDESESFLAEEAIPSTSG